MITAPDPNQWLNSAGQLSGLTASQVGVWQSFVFGNRLSVEKIDFCSIIIFIKNNVTIVIIGSASAGTQACIEG